MASADNKLMSSLRVSSKVVKLKLPSTNELSYNINIIIATLRREREITPFKYQTLTHLSTTHASLSLSLLSIPNRLG
ncbi:hypothetical protein RIF29_32125 [Crotalaria pallida]|uniref:Uncharacterized protein n=1 Tax=Crotalaria pallida TaxID=3830 RepID=A0AAN9EHT5_CROPI